MVIIKLVTNVVIIASPVGEKQIRAEKKEEGPRQWGPWAPYIASQGHSGG